MARFPTELTRTITVDAPLARVHARLADVVGSATGLPNIAACEAVGADTYRFTSVERGVGPLTMVVRYTARYEDNGVDRITFRGIGAPGDTADVDGSLELSVLPGGATRIAFRQMIAPETPVPVLLQGLVRSFVEREATSEMDVFLGNVKRAAERGG